MHILIVCLLIDLKMLLTIIDWAYLSANIQVKEVGSQDGVANETTLACVKAA